MIDANCQKVSAKARFDSDFLNRHRFFDRDRNVDNDIPAVRKLRIEVVMLPWLGLTTLLVILLINLWRA